MNTLSDYKEKIFNVLIILVWMQTILMQYVRAVFMRIPIIGAYPDLIIGMVYAAVIIFSLPYFKISIGDLVFLFVPSIVFLLEWMFYKEASEYLDAYFVDFVLKTLPLYVLGVNLSASENKDKIFHTIYIFSIVTLITNIIYQYACAAPMSEVESLYNGNMDLAYKLLPHCCFIAYHAVKKFNVWNVAFTVIGGFYLLMLGTRGAAIIYLISIAVFLIIGQTAKGKMARIIVIFGAVSAFFASPLFYKFILWMYKKAQSFGLSVRIFEKLISGTVFESSGRDAIRETLLSSIKNNPFFGYGICSDRVIAGSYAHNVVIELWVEFGVIIGTVLFIAAAVLILRGFLNCRNDYEKGFILSLIFASFFKLFLSGSYLDERLLFLLLGMCAYNIRQANKNGGKYKMNQLC